MTNTLRQRIEKMRLGAASVALTLVAALGLGVVTTQSAQAQSYKETVLHSFIGFPDGANPVAGLIFDAKGNLYSTTPDGGSYDGWGTLFTLDPSGTETVLHSFTGGTDGGNPVAGLIFDPKGNLYSTTTYGGNPGCKGFGCGVVFAWDPSGTETVLYSFTGGTNGGNPYAGLIRDAKGNLYGTTAYGGASGGGTVFKVSSTREETVLYNFTGGTDGAYPHAGLIRDAKGNLYGTTSYGGTSGVGNGTVFKVSSTGTETVLYRFKGGADGANPHAGLITDAKGNLYGTTSYGGAHDCGTVFKVSGKGQETVLHSFTGGADGAYPHAGLILDAKGNLYGNTSGGEVDYDYGTVFKVSSKGTETVLYRFKGGADGANPYADLIMDAKGNLYGTTQGGGASNNGTVFKMSMKP